MINEVSKDEILKLKQNKTKSIEKPKENINIDNGIVEINACPSHFKFYDFNIFNIRPLTFKEVKIISSNQKLSLDLFLKVYSKAIINIENIVDLIELDFRFLCLNINQITKPDYIIPVGFQCDCGYFNSFTLSVSDLEYDEKDKTKILELDETFEIKPLRVKDYLALETLRPHLKSILEDELPDEDLVKLVLAIDWTIADNSNTERLKELYNYIANLPYPKVGNKIDNILKWLNTGIKPVDTECKQCKMKWSIDLGLEDYNRIGL